MSDDIKIPENIKLPYDPHPCVYALIFPDSEEIYVGMTMGPLAVRIESHFEHARKKKRHYRSNTDLYKLVRLALSGQVRMEVKVLEKGNFTKEDLQQKEAEEIMEVLGAGKFSLLNIEIPTNIVDGKKYCPRCKKKKLPKKFGRRSTNNSGLSSWCKSCHRNYSRERTKILAQKKVVQYTLFDPISTHASVDVTGPIVLINT